MTILVTQQIFVSFPQRGVWRYKVENRADSHQGLHIQVTAQPSAGPNAINEVSVKIWTNQDENDQPENINQKSIVMYSEVKVSRIYIYY